MCLGKIYRKAIFSAGQRRTVGQHRHHIISQRPVGSEGQQSAVHTATVSNNGMLLRLKIGV